MKELMKHIPAIKSFIEERTQTLQELSDNMVKRFLTEAYKLPFLFPVRIIVSEEKFVNFLFDMRKDLFEGKKIDSAIQQEINKDTDKKTEAEPEVRQVEKEVIAKEETETITAKTAKAKNTKKAVKKTTESVSTKVVKSSTNSQKNKTDKTKKEKVLV
jgi:hypothetical protein